MDNNEQSSSMNDQRSSMNNQNPQVPTGPTIAQPNSNPQTQPPQTPPVQPTPQDPQPQSIVDSQIPSQSAGSGNKNKIILIGLAVLILIFIVVGVYFMVQSSQTTQPTTNQADQQARDISIFTQEVESEITSADPGTLDEDFTSVDQELNSL